MEGHMIILQKKNKEFEKALDNIYKISLKFNKYSFTRIKVLINLVAK